MTGDDRNQELELGLPSADPAGAVPRDGLSWTWDLDIEALLAAVTGPAPWTRDPSTAPGQPAAPGYSAGHAHSPGGAGSAEDPRSAAGAGSAEDAVPPVAGTEPAATAGPAAEPAQPGSAAESAAAESAGDAEPAAMAGPDLAGALDPVEADFAEYLDAVEAGRFQVLPLPVLAGRVAESVPAGPGLAGWLGAGEVSGLEDGALAGIASSYRRLASWAQAGELAAVAEIASRSAAADDRAGTSDDGRPARIPAGACAEVSLALTMSQSAATWWADLAVTLRWRLASTGAALAAGAIDLARARAIADATACLDDDTAQTVQDKVLAKAGSQTTAQLRAALRRAVISADPAGADRRREEAERQARVMLYPDDNGTATLAGYSLPGIHAAAAMARITALATALKASGTGGGGIDRLRAHVYLGLLLGTLPYIPPPPGSPPDQPPPEDDAPPDSEPPGGGEPPGGSLPGDEPSGDGLRGDGPGGDGPAGGHPHDGEQPSGDLPRDQARRRAPADCPGRDDHRSQDRATPPASQDSHRKDRATPVGSRTSDRKDPRHDHGSHRENPPGEQRPDREPARAGSGGQASDDNSRPEDRYDQPPDHDDQGRRSAARGGRAQDGNDQGGRPVARSGQARDGGDDCPNPAAGHPDREGPRDSQSARGSPAEAGGPAGGSPAEAGGPAGGSPAEAGGPARGSPAGTGEPAWGDDAWYDSGEERAWAQPPPAWPEVPAFLQVGPAAMDHLIPVGGAGKLLDLRLPWITLIGKSLQPGYLGRIGPITPGQARHLAGLATADPAARWQIILTNPQGQAVATTWLTRQATSTRQQRAGLTGQRVGLTEQRAGLIKHVTVTLWVDDLDDARLDDTYLDGLPPGLRRILATARHLADHAARQAARDAQADHQCAHDDATASYRPTVRLRDYITARDLTCRFPTCRQPVWRCDVDHTKPFDQGGRTCSCNLGGLCRFHHQVKGQVRWHLDQPVPGVFTWTTPAGRRYATQPDSHAA